MPGQGRIGDKAMGIDAHGCTACPHMVTGPGVQGSFDVTVNGKPAMYKGAQGVHAACCGTNVWTAAGCSNTVIINGKGAFRMGDETVHCGGRGRLMGGSSTVIVGNSQSAAFKKAARSHAPFVCNCRK